MKRVALALTIFIALVLSISTVSACTGYSCYRTSYTVRWDGYEISYEKYKYEPRHHGHYYYYDGYYSQPYYYYYYGYYPAYQYSQMPWYNIYGPYAYTYPYYQYEYPWKYWGYGYYDFGPIYKDRRPAVFGKVEEDIWKT